MHHQQVHFDFCPMTTDVSAHVVFLSLNDVYKFLPDDDGIGGMAEMASLVDHVRATLPVGAYPIVTLNGDFLWRHELERPDKAEFMIGLLQDLGVEYVVLGNHEFDFGVRRLLELLPNMPFKILGSNVRLPSPLTPGGELLPGVIDHEIIELPASGIKLGVFGVLTSAIHEYVDQDDLILLESEVDHARRNVHALQELGADVIVALTHTRLAKDRLIARHVPGIDLILGGHDHEPFTLVEKGTLIHKSGFNAVWLARIDAFVTKYAPKEYGGRVGVHFEWSMLANRGWPAKPQLRMRIDDYLEQVACDQDPAMVKTLATTAHAMDGTRLTLRTGESNLANLITDAMRCELQADVAFLNGGCIMGECWHSAQTKITRAWLQDVLAIENRIVRVRLRVGALRKALLTYLGRYPNPNASHPHLSGMVGTYHTASKGLHLYWDHERERDIDDDTIVEVATSEWVLQQQEGCEHLQAGEIVAVGPVTRDIVEAFVQKLPDQRVTNPVREGRLVIIEEEAP